MKSCWPPWGWKKRSGSCSWVHLILSSISAAFCLCSGDKSGNLSCNFFNSASSGGGNLGINHLRGDCGPEAAIENLFECREGSVEVLHVGPTSEFVEAECVGPLLTTALELALFLCLARSAPVVAALAFDKLSHLFLGPLIPNS